MFEPETIKINHQNCGKLIILQFNLVANPFYDHQLNAYEYEILFDLHHHLY